MNDTSPSSVGFEEHSIVLLLQATIKADDLSFKLVTTTPPDTLLFLQLTLRDYYQVQGGQEGKKESEPLHPVVARLVTALESSKTLPPGRPQQFLAADICLLSLVGASSLFFDQ